VHTNHPQMQQHLLSLPLLLPLLLHAQLLLRL
jgi:hypothetical protein